MSMHHPDPRPKASAEPGRRACLRAGALVLAPATLLTACAANAPPPGVTPVSPFELPRYQGLWFEIARLDNWFERGLSDVTARYTPQADGSIEVINRGYDASAGRWREAHGRALPTAGPNTGSLKVSFFGPFYGGYHVAALDADYQWALVIGAGLDYCWLLARTRTLSAPLRETITLQARSLGVDTASWVWVPQTRPDATS